MTTPALNLSTSELIVATPKPSAPGPQWLREPLLHFVVLGGLLFGLDHLLLTRSEDPHTIVVSAEVDSEAIETFRAARGHEPNAAELTALRHVWLDNEVLYREGLALGVDRGDAAIRDRVIFKALSVVDSNVKLPPIDDAGLRKWFEAHRDKYDEPTRYDFDEAVLSGDSSEAAVVAFVKELNNGTPGDAKAGLRVFKGRPQSNLVQSYGQGLADALVKVTPGQWQALGTKDGWRALRLNTIAPAKPASFGVVRNVVMADWTDATASEQRSAAVSELTKKYKIKHEVPQKDSGE